jgi:hypothetical protein
MVFYIHVNKDVPTIEELKLDAWITGQHELSSRELLLVLPRTLTGNVLPWAMLTLLMRVGKDSGRILDV